jgi:hypothetical protein
MVVALGSTIAAHGSLRIKQLRLRLRIKQLMLSGGCSMWPAGA